MPLQPEQRSVLLSTVSGVKKTLEADFLSQCQSRYGIQPDGSTRVVEDLVGLTDEERTRARALRDRIYHLSSGSAETQSRKEAVAQLLREESFTVLNRFCALRMAEKRSLVKESLHKGYESTGFQVFESIAKNIADTSYQRYVTYVNLLFDELAVDLGLLYDRYALNGLLFPGESALMDVLTNLDRPELDEVWTDDEAIGWVFQYFNSQEERQAMRKASGAPRNGREMAVRNQFFTPRYVVEFLSDNTVGRMWYEMRKGDTALRGQCRYMLRPQGEIFFDVGKSLTESKDGEGPPEVRHRPKKDPRDIRILDPACGSGHFLLYVYDLMETIYREAWADTDAPPSEATGHTLHEDYPDDEDFDRRIPELILRWNLHGVDIDARAVQIAATALWLRAQRSWSNAAVSVTVRPKIAKTNFVCAEPMPGNQDMFVEFTKGMSPPLLGQLTQTIFEKMKLAGEAGTLLEIEKEITGAIASAKKAWNAVPDYTQKEMFSEYATERPGSLGYDFSGIKEESFWDMAETSILGHLRSYADIETSGIGSSRRLFAEDASQGFAFIDLSRKKFDVVLMNPPFGAIGVNTKDYVGKTYPLSKNDLLTAFIDRGARIIGPSGRIGAITSRTCFFLTTYKKWREEIILGEVRPVLMADLGHGVMDEAMVEAAAYVLEKKS